MPRNTLNDLNNHLFAQLERLGDEDLSIEELKLEVDRAKAMNSVAEQIIDNARTTLTGIKVMNEHLDQTKEIPEQFRLKQS